MTTEGHHTVYPITRATRFEGEARPPETPEDLVRADLRLNPGAGAGRARRDRPEDHLAGLGSGPSARRNFQTIRRMERVHGGRIDMTRLAEQIRTFNEVLIGELDDRSAPGQALLLGATNQSEDLETLVRLNERLNVLVHNLENLEVEETEHSARIEAEHAEHEEEVTARRTEITDEMTALEGEIARAEAVLAVDRELRDLRRERSRVRRTLRRLRRVLRHTRRQTARSRREDQIRAQEERLREIDDVTMPALAERQAEAAAAEEAGRTTTGRGAGSRSMRVRRNWLVRRRTMRERDLANLETEGGYYTAHPGSRDAFRGIRRDGDRRQREPRVTGRLDNVQPALPWRDLIVPGQPSAAVEARRAHREAAREERRRRRRRRH